VVEFAVVFGLCRSLRRYGGRPPADCSWERTLADLLSMSGSGRKADMPNQRVWGLQVTQVRHRTNSWALGAGAQTAVYARLGFVTITPPEARYDFLASRLVVGMSVALIYD
jgi:hypothetical protein